MEKKGFINEFKNFAMKGNVLDLAVGVIIATAFGKITTSLINDVLMPIIGYLIGDFDLVAYNVVLSPEVLDAAGEVVKPAVVIGFGTLISTIVNFILVAFVVFLIVKSAKKAEEKKRKEAEAAAAAATAKEEPKPTTEELLTSILEELKKNK